MKWRDATQRRDVQRLGRAARLDSRLVRRNWIGQLLKSTIYLEMKNIGIDNHATLVDWLGSHLGICKLLKSIFTVNCIEKTKIYEKRPVMSIF